MDRIQDPVKARSMALPENRFVLSLFYHPASPRGTLLALLEQLSDGSHGTHSISVSRPLTAVALLDLIHDST
jgi:hypothetical protein